MASLITLTEYKLMLGINPALTTHDAQIEALIPAASNAVQKFVDRRFEAAASPSARTFSYDGSGFLDTDDFTDLQEVAANAPFTGGIPIPLDESNYTAMPYRETDDDDPHYYVVFHAPFAGFSPEMGFERNLDKWDGPVAPLVVTITASWGWPAVPDDVKLAVAWTVQDTLTKPSSGDIRGESIESYSRQYQPTSGNMLAVPNRARDLLANYQRPF